MSSIPFVVPAQTQVFQPLDTEGGTPIIAETGTTIVVPKSSQKFPSSVLNTGTIAGPAKSGP